MQCPSLHTKCWKRRGHASTSYTVTLIKIYSIKICWWYQSNTNPVKFAVASTSGKRNALTLQPTCTRPFCLKIVAAEFVPRPTIPAPPANMGRPVPPHPPTMNFTLSPTFLYPFLSNFSIKINNDNDFAWFLKFQFGLCMLS